MQSNAKQNVEHLWNPTIIHNGSNKQQRIINNRTTALERTAAYATEGLNAFYRYQIFALDLFLLKHKHKQLRLHGCFLPNKVVTYLLTYYLLQCIIIENQPNQNNAI